MRRFRHASMDAAWTALRLVEKGEPRSRIRLYRQALKAEGRVTVTTADGEAFAFMAVA